MQQIVAPVKYRGNFFLHDARAPSGPGPSYHRGFRIRFRHTTLGMTPLEEWSVQCRDLYLTTHNTHKRQESMSWAGFEPAIPTSEMSQSQSLDRAVTGIGIICNHHVLKKTTFQNLVLVASIVPSIAHNYFYHRQLVLTARILRCCETVETYLFHG
jgi:hypothetical protein